MSDSPMKPGGHYSGTNPIPSIQKFTADLAQGGEDEVSSHKATHFHVGNVNTKRSTIDLSRETVTDPTTGKEVRIENSDTSSTKFIDNPTISVPNANISRGTTSEAGGEEKVKKFQNSASSPCPIESGSTSNLPIKDEKTNILFYPTPSISYEPMYKAIEMRAKLLCIGVLVAIIIPGRLIGGAILGLIPLGLIVSCGIFLWMKDLVQRGRSNEWQSEKQRGQRATTNLIPESAEWMNSLLEVFWGLIDPVKFSAVADTLEDVMQASVPSMIENVRVAEINQGTNPIRILSLRALPDGHDVKEKSRILRQNLSKETQKPIADNDCGDFYNLECSLAYHSESSNVTSAVTKGMHMQLVFYIGVKGLFGVPLPIFVELERLIATARLRLQISPEPPFFTTLTLTLLGLPRIQARCVPMIRTGVNLLDLPLISSFVNYAISAAANEYVAPKSITIDMRKMLQGDDIQKEVEALGILWIKIHKAIGLSKQDFRGSEDGGSDPYITASFSKYGKSVYCTRVIQDSLNPVWEETCALLVTPDLLKIDEKLSMELWDSDRSTSDDMVGKVELSLQKISSHPGKMYPQTSRLRNLKEENLMPGVLHWEVGYFGKAQFRAESRTQGKDVNLPEKFKDMKELQDEKGTFDTPTEFAVVHTPPDPLWPSGICSVIVHQIVDLGLHNIDGSDGKRKGREYEPAQEISDTKKEEEKGLPSSYCAILFNDQLMYRTRTKVTNSRPIFNAGTERFMRDWRSGIVTITVRDQRMREHDPILGVISLKLTDILQTSSQVTRWYPLSGGIGYGRIRVSLLFRSIETCLPPEQLGWDVGTFEITSNEILATRFNLNSKVKIRTGGSSAKISRVHCQQIMNNEGIFWDISKNKRKHSLFLPVKYRYRCPVVFEFHSSKMLSADAYAIIWLHLLEDGKEYNFNIPIWRTNNGIRLTQNYVTEENVEDIPGLQIEEVGHLKFKGHFKAGIDYEHRRFITDCDSRETQEMWEACKSKGLRGINITKEVTQITYDSHDMLISHVDHPNTQKVFEERKKDYDRILETELAHLRKDTDFDEHKDSELDLEHVSSASMDIPMTRLEISENISSDESDLGQDDFEHTKRDMEELSEYSNSKNPFKQAKFYKEHKDNLHRQQRGLMQWKPMRNLAFAKNETKYLWRNTLRKTSLQGRQPDVETET